MVQKEVEKKFDMERRQKKNSTISFESGHLDGSETINTSYKPELDDLTQVSQEDTPDSFFLLKKIIQSLSIKNINRFIPKIDKFTFWGI